jgi:preprotein translocase subunit SecE
MAAKSKKEAPKKTKATSKDEANITRITAKDTSTKTTKTQVAKASNPARKSKKGNIFSAMGGYFKGAWYELKQVRWPTRKATWGLTLAVMVFTGFFVAMIVLLDLGFQQLFELIVN